MNTKQSSGVRYQVLIMVIVIFLVLVTTGFQDWMAIAATLAVMATVWFIPWAYRVICRKVPRGLQPDE